MASSTAFLHMCQLEAPIMQPEKGYREVLEWGKYLQRKLICVNCWISCWCRSSNRMYLSDGNWFDFKDGKSYANSDLNKAPTFFNANAAFSEHNDIAFAFFFICHSNCRGRKAASVLVSISNCYLRSTWFSREHRMFNYINWNRESRSLFSIKFRESEMEQTRESQRYQNDKRNWE